MPIPSIGSVLTPSNFQITSCEGLVQLDWSQTPLVTIYYISRSIDNITFTELGTTTLTTFQDTTGTINTTYYYYIQAGNGTFSSQPTVTKSGIPLGRGKTTAGNLIQEAQQRCNKENSQFYTTQELISMTSQSYKELFDKLVQAYGDDYFVATPFTYTTGQNQQLYPLPQDFFKLLLCEVALNPQDPNSYVTIKQFNLIQKNLWNYPNMYTMYGITNIRYRLNGDNLMIVPQTQGNQTLRIWYIPRPKQLLNFLDIIDGVSGWEEYIISDVCVKMLTKEESDPSIFAQQKMALTQRLDEMAKNRNVSEPQTVSDSKYRNFSWGGGEWSNGGGGMF